MPRLQAKRRRQTKLKQHSKRHTYFSIIVLFSGFSMACCHFDLRFNSSYSSYRCAGIQAPRPTLFETNPLAFNLMWFCIVLLTHALINSSSLIVLLNRLPLLTPPPPPCSHQRLHPASVNGSFVFVVALLLCSGGDRQGRAASKQPADSQPNPSAAAGTGESAAQRKEAVRSLAAKVHQNAHGHAHIHTHTS